jgi:hypothetical protein
MVIIRQLVSVRNASRPQRTYDGQCYDGRALRTHNRHHVQCIVCDTVRLAARLACTSTSHRHPTAAGEPCAYHLPPYGCTSRPSVARLATTVPSCTAAMAAAALLAVLRALFGSSFASELQSLQEVLESHSLPSSSRHWSRPPCLATVAPTALLRRAVRITMYEQRPWTNCCAPCSPGVLLLQP